MSNEWYTQPKYIAAARLVMGEIDLDPASCEAANQTVRATRYYTKEENGLLQHWCGRVWLNPPYGRSAKMQGLHQSSIKLFVDKCLQHYQDGDISQAILLVTTEVNARWFQPLWNYTICFADHRVNFNISKLPQSKKYSQMFGTCFVYLGPHKDRFTEIFSQFGRVVRAIDTPEPRPITLSLWERDHSNVC